jgi:hypothetical protein
MRKTPFSFWVKKPLSGQKGKNSFEAKRKL